MSKFNNIEEIRYHLKISQIERQIALEKIKASGKSIKDVSFAPLKILGTTLALGSSSKIFKLFFLLKKLL